jgi:bifunctional DNA-binding transcriptional regulator/antitoxin component of YhaV-PrlF toxin-antitoxin module
MGEITVLSKATTTSKSLRTTVPSGIVRQLNLKEGDELGWEIRAENGKLVVTVKTFKRKRR